MCRVFVCVCFSVCVFVFLISSVYVFDALLDFLLSTVFIFCLFSFCVCMLFCFQFSLPITKYFVCFAYNWMFLLALSYLFVSTKVLFFALFCEWFMFAFALWMVSFSMTLCGRCCVHCLWFLFAVFVWVLFTHSLSFKYLDQRVGFFHCFLMISFCCFA